MAEYYISPLDSNTVQLASWLNNPFVQQCTISFYINHWPYHEIYLAAGFCVLRVHFGIKTTSGYDVTVDEHGR